MPSTLIAGSCHCSYSKTASLSLLFTGRSFEVCLGTALPCTRLHRRIFFSTLEQVRELLSSHWPGGMTFAVGSSGFSLGHQLRICVRRSPRATLDKPAHRRKVVATIERHARTDSKNECSLPTLGCAADSRQLGKLEKRKPQIVPKSHAISTRSSFFYHTNALLRTGPSTMDRRLAFRRSRISSYTVRTANRWRCFAPRTGKLVASAAPYSSAADEVVSVEGV